MRRMDVVTRFAPSPTGFLHAGNYRTAIFSYLFARHYNGKFILRIEDTDRARSKKEYEEDVLKALAWLGLEYDAFYRQSESLGRHEALLRDLVARQVAYVSREKSEDGTERDLIRFKNPNTAVTFNDVIRGPITFDTTELNDFVIAKGFDQPLFHLAVVADDAEQGVTHVIRGEDHISNTPRQILIYQAIGKPIPQYAHLPLVLAPDRSKLSKRNGARPLLAYRDLGFLPEALLNYITLLGWHPGTDEEIFSRSELIQRFTLEQVQKSGAIFDEVKLRWVNRQHLAAMSDEAFLRACLEYCSPPMQALLGDAEKSASILPQLRERLETFGDMPVLEAAGEFAFYTARPSIDIKALVWKKDPDIQRTKSRLEKVVRIFNDMSVSWNAGSIKEVLWPFAETEGRGEVLWPLRYALSGREKSPDPFIIAGILGKDETCLRLQQVIALIP